MNHKNISGGQELLCINTEKVYDWIINDANFDINLADLAIPEGLVCDDIDYLSVSCNVIPVEFTEDDILEREDQDFVIDGEEITLQVVTIQKSFDVEVEVDGVDDPIEAGTFTRTEQVVLCAPEGTDISVEFTEVDCSIVTIDCDDEGLTFDLTVEVRLCQSIQATYDVTLELVAEFCEPREELVIPTGPCPLPTVPPQCPVLFPANGENG